VRYNRFLTVTQTLEIPADWRLILKIPPEIPNGKVILTFTPVSEPPANGNTHRLTSREAIEYCRGLGKRMGSRLTGDMSIKWRREDKALEDAIDSRR
jgi:hypothetical protein